MTIPAMEKANFGALAVCATLLLLLLWRIEAMSDAIEDRGSMGSGQEVTTGPVTTERYLGESLQAWSRRHMDAIREFE